MTHEKTFKPLPTFPSLTLDEVIRLEEGLRLNPDAQAVLAEIMARPESAQFDPAELLLSLLVAIDEATGL